MFRFFLLQTTALLTTLIPLFSQEPIITSHKLQSSELVNAVEHSLNATLKAEDPLFEGIYSIKGMSGRKYRLFINTLIKNLNNPSYLEVGTWAGSTLCSAIHGNKVNAVAIDNWSQFGGPRELFFKNIQTYVTPEVFLTVIENDFRAVDYSAIGTFNVYLFDGPHSEQDQYDGLHLALNALENEFIFIVDDWNWPQVRKGTLNAIKSNNLRVLYSAEVRTTSDNTHPKIAHEASLWHNGYFISVLAKQEEN